MPIDGATSIWVVASRLTPLDASTFAPDPGSLVYSTDTLMKATFQPTVETGDAVLQKNASGNLSVAAKHDDIPWIGDITIDLATSNPILEGLLCGGSVYTASGAALGTPTGLTVTGQTTLGTLAAGTYGYRAAHYNQYGQTTACADVTVTTTGSTSTVVITGPTFVAGSLGAYIYGRTIGSEKFIGIIPNLGSQATGATSGAGAVTSLTVTALTQSIPAGTTFQITGDSNSPKIVWTTTAFAPVGAVTLQVTASQSVTTTIAAAAIIPCLVDAGAAVTSALAVQTTDTTAGPGLGVGIAVSTLGTPGNSVGVSLEVFSQAWLLGQQAYPQPFWRWVFPRITGGYVTARDSTNANMATSIKAIARQNPNWGTGPFGDWQLSSTNWWQRARCGAEIVPAVSLTGVAATN
jgi:hypothetical protein